MANQKVIYIAHPVGGDVRKNIKKILVICKKVHKRGNIPLAPYLVALQYLDDTVLHDRELGIEANLIHLQRKFIDEVWLFGDKISSGMEQEVLLALELSIRVVAQTQETKAALLRMIMAKKP